MENETNKIEEKNIKYDAQTDEITKDVVVTTSVAIPYVQIENEYNNLCAERDIILAKIAELEPMINLKQ